MYFFSIEFGLSLENQEEHGNSGYKVYGAGLLSSADELQVGERGEGERQHAVSDKAVIHVFDPERVVSQECLVTTFQDAYFFTRNFDEAQHKLR